MRQFKSIAFFLFIHFLSSPSIFSSSPPNQSATNDEFGPGTIYIGSQIPKTLLEAAYKSLNNSSYKINRITILKRWPRVNNHWELKVEIGGNAFIRNFLIPMTSAAVPPTPDSLENRSTLASESGNSAELFATHISLGDYLKTLTIGDVLHASAIHPQLLGLVYAVLNFSDYEIERVSIRKLRNLGGGKWWLDVAIGNNAFHREFEVDENQILEKTKNPYIAHRFSKRAQPVQPSKTDDDLFYTTIGPSLSADQLIQAISVRRRWIPELELIGQIAHSLGFRIFLFGGGASTLANYIALDLMRENGDHSILSERFNYLLDSVFKSTQDLDFVLEGRQPGMTSSRSIKLMKKAFQKILGSKPFDLILKTSLGETSSGMPIQPLENSSEWLGQHSDSLSTGLIELTAPREGVQVVSDLRSATDSLPLFLEGISKREIRFLFSANHENTQRAQYGKNPPILSAIRFLTKLLRYDLKTDTESVFHLKRIINAFYPRDLFGNDYDGFSEAEAYVHHWLIRNSKKLVKHAARIERAFDILDSLGLREKLLKLDSEDEFSLEGLLQREPLRRVEMLRPEDSFYKRFKISHATTSLSAFESIVGNPRGLPNFLISRPGKDFEDAWYGTGVYFMEGEDGAANGASHDDEEPEIIHTAQFLLPDYVQEGQDYTETDGEIIINSRHNPRFKLVPFWKVRPILDKLRQWEKSPEAIPESLRSETPSIFLEETPLKNTLSAWKDPEYQCRNIISKLFIKTFLKKRRGSVPVVANW